MSTDDYYNSNAEEFYNSTINLDMSSIYKKFEELVPSNSKILDAGCGSGRDSKYFISQGYIVTAFDSSDELCRLSSNAIDQKVLHLKFNEINFYNEFQAVWACASLLHLNHNELVEALRKISQSLVVGGVFYSSFKYGNFQGERAGRYFYDFNEDNLKIILESNGFVIQELWTTMDVRFEVSQKWINCLAIKRQ